MKGQLAEMMARTARAGRLEWIGLRPERRGMIEAVEDIEIGASGLVGDHARAGKRAVTLIQAEHLPVIAALTGRDITPAILRRNLVVSGLNLAAFRGADITVGDAILTIEVPCPPCSRMEEALGPGGYNAMRGHGGWCASVRQPGRIAIGQSVDPVPRG